MSTKPHSIWLILTVFGLILQFFTFGSGQDIETTITIARDKDSLAAIRAEFVSKTQTADDSRKLWFLDDYAGLRGLTDRLSAVYVYDKQGYLIAIRSFSAVDTPNTRFIGRLDYSIDLKQRSAAAAAHISWIDNETGLLMLEDMLPQSMGKTAKVRLMLPSGWTVNSSEMETEPRVFRVANVEKAIFAVGKGWRQSEKRTRDSILNVALNGEWRFGDDDVADMGGSIFESYSRTFGGVPSARSQIVMFHMPAGVPFDRWEAETRGSTVVITSSDMPFDTQSKQRLHEQLRHEMFHLWIPNGVNLSGTYDWFYEGFALYQSLRMGVVTNRIRFDDFLDTLGRAMTADKMHSNGISLIDASKNRFSGANSTVYARGMVVAFLCDLALLERSKGKRSVENILSDLYQKHHNSAARADGNDAVLSIFAEHPELSPIVERYIKKGEIVAVDEYFNYAGIEAVTQNSVTTLKVLSKPNSRQKDLLNKLGYNTWRKLAIISK